jgi:hypothetical protein
MDTHDTDHLEEAADLDVRRLKRMLAARADATSEFQRVKTAMLGYGAAALRPATASRQRPPAD